MKKNPIIVLLISLFSISLAMNVVISAENKKVIEKGIGDKYIQKHHFAQKELLSSKNKKKFNQHKKEVEAAYDVAILEVNYYGELKDLTKTFKKEKAEKMKKEFKQNKAAEFIHKGTFYQFIPIEKGKEGFIRIAYDGESYKKEIKERNESFLLQVGTLFVFHVIVLLIVLVIVTRVKGVFEKNQPQ